MSGGCDALGGSDEDVEPGYGYSGVCDCEWVCDVDSVSWVSAAVMFMSVCG